LHIKELFTCKQLLFIFANLSGNRKEPSSTKIPPIEGKARIAVLKKLNLMCGILKKLKLGLTMYHAQNAANYVK